MLSNPFKFFMTLFMMNTIIWCCEFGYLEIDGDCYFYKDLDFLEVLIENSQSGNNPPPVGMNPLELGWQLWENGRLIELCSSTATNTECHMDYGLSGNIPTEIGHVTELKILSLKSNSLNGMLPNGIGNLSQLEELSLSSNNIRGNIPKEIGNLLSLQILALKGNNFSGSLPPEIIQLKNMRWM